jgi:hypothetical protein
MPTAASPLLAIIAVDPWTAILSLATCLAVGAAIGLAFASRYRQQYHAAARELASLRGQNFHDTIPTVGIPRVTAGSTPAPASAATSSGPAAGAPSSIATTAANSPTLERERNTLRQERDELLARNRELKRQLDAEFEKAVAHRENLRTIEQLRHEQEQLRQQIQHKLTQLTQLGDERQASERKLAQSLEHVDQLRLFLGQHEARIASLERERDAFRTRAEICEQQRR